MATCPSCKYSISRDALKCPNCGVALAATSAQNAFMFVGIALAYTKMEFK